VEPESSAGPIGSRSERLLRLVPLMVIGGGLLIWEAGARAGVVSPLFYPAPSTIAEALAGLARSGELSGNLAATLARIFGGFAVGGGAALILGLCMGWSRRLSMALDPLVAAAHPVPRLALLPLILLIFGLGETSRILVVALSSFFPMLINAAAGVRQIRPIYFEVARNFGARPLQVFTHVVLPGSVPSLLTGARLGLVSALKTTLAIELIASERGLGHFLWLAWETFRPADLYATLLVIAALGILLNASLRWLASRVAPAEAVVSS
jgi:ABC-type nitrate/sulfonate/bicarbonate transport system permease component